ncbi:MAG: hypothetical protein QXI60_08970 [Thermofilaceae archaeon]
MKLGELMVYFCRFHWIGVMFVAGFLGGCHRASPPSTGSRGTSLIHKVIRAQRLDIDSSGRQLVYVGSGHGSTDIYLLDLATLRVRQLTNTPVDEYYPSFSRDGKHVIFSTADLTIKWLDLDTGKIKTLYKSKTFMPISPILNSKKNQLFFAQASGFRSYSLGGKKATNYRLWSLSVSANAHGSVQPMRLTNFEADSISSLSLSPKEDKIVFSARLRKGAGEGVFILDLRHRSISPIFVSNHYTVGDAIFSPSGNEVIFISDIYANQTKYDIYKINIKSKFISKITSLEQYIIAPTFTDDGRYIYFCIWDRGDRLELWRVRVADGVSTKIADTTLFADPLHWHP